jgi:hypothetical protein
VRVKSDQVGSKTGLGDSPDDKPATPQEVEERLKSLRLLFVQRAGPECPSRFAKFAKR